MNETETYQTAQTFARLLVPLDGSRLAESALPPAERFAAAFDSEVLLLHVMERGARPTVHGDRHLIDQAAAEAYLGGLVEGLRSRGVNASWHVHNVPRGDVAASIAEHGTEERTDLIVLCTHGRGGVRDFLWGGIAQQALQRGTTPVLLVRAPAGGTDPAVFAPETILVALDATAAAEAALPIATLLAAKLGTRLHLTMVVATLETVRDDLRGASLLMPTATRAILDSEQEQAGIYLEGIARELRASGIAVETEVRRGDAAQQLAGDVSEHHAGLIVAATHGRAGLQAVWAGGTVARLLGRTSAPVLLLRTVER
ncbi:MAG: universal stress protein [Chloroflexota bacterium]|nr:MAG: universal stress protein [Chloroflexota bacterium]